MRIYATVRHFARWRHRKFPDLFPLGCPTDGVKPPAESTAEWKGLTRVEEIRLLSAAQTLRVRPSPGTGQGMRNHALFAVLLGSGLRVSEVLNLERGQYTGKGFSRVAVKGGGVRDFVPVQRDARQVLDSWLESREDEFSAIFPTRSGRALSRREAAAVIRRIAAQANAHLAEDEKIDVSPHVTLLVNAPCPRFQALGASFIQGICWPLVIFDCHLQRRLPERFGINQQSRMCLGIRFCASSPKPRACSMPARPPATSPTVTYGATSNPTGRHWRMRLMSWSRQKDNKT